MTYYKSILLALSLAIAYSTPLLAHALNVFAYELDNKIYVESYFSPKGHPVKPKIEVYNANNDKILEGTGTAKGTFSFDSPQNYQKLTIVVISDKHHQGSFVLQGRS